MGNVFVVDNGFQIALYAAYGVFSSWAMFCVSWRFKRTCSSSCVMSLMEISKLRSWKMMHSTMNIRPFLLMLMDSRFSSLSEGQPLCLADEVGNFLKLTDREYLFSGL